MQMLIGGSNTSLKNTGETGDEKCHIFDMAGNAREWTTEYCNGGEYPCTARGGVFGSMGKYIVAFRGDGNVGSVYKVTYKEVNIGFRVGLWVK